MVMQNRHDGANSSGWWDDLPPSVKKRLSRPQPQPQSEPQPNSKADRLAPAAEPPYRPTVMGDLSRFALIVLGIGLANVVFLLLALSFLFGRGPIGH